MRKIKAIVKRAIASRAGWPLANLFLRKRGVSVLMYHRVTRPDSPFMGLDVSLFRQQMHWLRRHCTLIEPEELLQQTCTAGWRSPPVLITFDDGYRDYYENAFPILEELKIPSVVFVATSFMDNGGLIWTETIRWAVAAAPARAVKLPWSPSASYDLTLSRERERLVDTAKLYLKRVPDAERKRGLNQLFAELGVSLDLGDIERQMMNWDEVRLIARGYTQIGGHSHTHPILSQLDAKAMEDEIRVCRDRIVTETGQRPKYFAYPNGRSQDFNEKTTGLLQKYGFELGFSSIEGINGPKMDNFAILRQHTGAGNLGDFACLVGGI
jgi:peptidoglycan/xylan/chitin deacetylase (PgdA/CDA1 family)